MFLWELLWQKLFSTEGRKSTSMIYRIYLCFLQKYWWIFSVNVDGERPLDYAIRLGRGDLCDLLIRFGVNPKLTPHINLAKSLQFTQIAEKLQGLFGKHTFNFFSLLILHVQIATYEWCQKIGLDHVGEECIKNCITKDQLPLLSGSSLDSLGFKSKQEKEKFVLEASRIGKGRRVVLFELQLMMLIQ